MEEQLVRSDGVNVFRRVFVGAAKLALRLAPLQLDRLRLTDCLT